MDLIFVLRIPLFLVVVGLLIFALPAGLIVGAALVAYLLWRWLNRKTRIEQERRAAAILIAVDELPRAERYDWYNKEGRYVAPGAIPRTLPIRFMTEEEKRRRENRTAEFGADRD
jgi:hypothetical protein